MDDARAAPHAACCCLLSLQCKSSLLGLEFLVHRAEIPKTDAPCLPSADDRRNPHSASTTLTLTQALPLILPYP